MTSDSRYMGCWIEKDNDREFEYLLYNKTERVSPMFCLDNCSSAGYSYAGNYCCIYKTILLYLLLSEEAEIVFVFLKMKFSQKFLNWFCGTDITYHTASWNIFFPWPTVTQTVTAGKNAIRLKEGIKFNLQCTKTAGLIKAICHTYTCIYLTGSLYVTIQLIKSQLNTKNWVKQASKITQNSEVKNFIPHP